MANQRMTRAKAQGVALRCVDKVGGQTSQLDDVLKTVGFPDSLSIRALRREIVHGGDGVEREGFEIATADLASIDSDSTVDDVAEAIRANAVRKVPAKAKPVAKGK